MKDSMILLLKKIYRFLTNKQFIYNLLGIMAFIAVILLGVMWWLKIYTHHGQRLEMPEYVGMAYADAKAYAKKRTFEVIVNDSVHIVGKPGGIIQNQNPKVGSFVKEGRKIYVTTTKYRPDVVDLADLLPIYGQPHEMVKAALERKGISTKIRGYQYDLTSNQVLEVWNGNERIIDSSVPPDNIPVEKGAQLEFILSNSEGGEQVVPDLLGLTVRQARFVLSRNKLEVGTITSDDGSPLEAVESAIIVRQIPPGDGLSTLGLGQTVDVVVQQ